MTPMSPTPTRRVGNTNILALKHISPVWVALALPRLNQCLGFGLHHVDQHKLHVLPDLVVKEVHKVGAALDGDLGVSVHLAHQRGKGRAGYGR